MTLIIILCGLMVEHFIGITSRVRRLDWFVSYQQWLENRLSQYAVWSGPVGLLLTLAIPLIVLLIIDYVLFKYFWPLELLFAFIIFIYTLGPRYLNPELDAYIHALDENDTDTARSIAVDMVGSEKQEDLDEQTIIENILLQSNDRLFAVLFWFLVLGPMGALMYRLTSVVRNRVLDIHGSYADAARDLYNILNWPTSRLLSLGYALTGNMVASIEGWFENESKSFAVNEKILTSSGLGALHYSTAYIQPKEISDDKSYWFRSTQGLINRTLILWLIVPAIITIYGKMI